MEAEEDKIWGDDRTKIENIRKKIKANRINLRTVFIIEPPHFFDDFIITWVMLFSAKMCIRDSAHGAVGNLSVTM